MSDGYKKRIRLPFWLTFLGAVLLLLSMLLPYASARDDYREYLLDHKDEMNIEEVDMTNSDAVHISLKEFIRIYLETAKEGIQRETGIATVTVIAVYGVFALLTLLLAVLKKPVGTVIFDLLAMAAFGVIRFDFKDRRVLPSDLYGWGITNVLVYAAGVLVLVGAVWLFWEK